MMGYALMPLAALVTTLGIEAPPQARDGSLVAWQGCWREVVAETDAVAPMLCILPGANAGEASLTPVVEGVPGPSTMLRVDGVARAVEEGGCTGTESARWSADGRRIFVRADLDCAGVPRVSSGVLALVSENEWVDVQAARVGSEYATRSRRYRAVRANEIPDELRPSLPAGRDLVVEAARLHAARPLQLEDVIEASSLIAAPALQGLLAAQGQGFKLDGQSLVALEEAGVAREVIDVVVALSYPKQFALRQPAAADDVEDRRARYATDCWDPWLGMRRYGSECDWLYSRYGYGYGRYGYGSGYGRWGYDGYGWNYNRPIVVVVRPDSEPRQPGELVKGRGYSRGSSSGSGTAQPRSRQADDASWSRGSTGGNASAGSGSSSGSSSAGSSTSSSGSGSSSSGDTGRTAKPRGGGD